MQDLLEGMLQKDKEEFRRICSRLLSVCFLSRANPSNKSDYYFVLKNRELFRGYLEVLGFRLEINEEYGVIQLTNPHNYNHLNLKLMESVILMLLRALYDEKKRELSEIDEVIVNIGDIQDRFMSFGIRDKMIDRVTMRNAMSLFRRMQLIEILDSDLSREESRILIYDAILMAVRVDDIKAVYDRIKLYRKGNGTDEDTDAYEADQLAPFH